MRCINRLCKTGSSYRSGFVAIAAVFILLFVQSPNAIADSKVIKTSAVKLSNEDPPAIDLLLNNESPLDPDHAADLRKSGVDLSLLNPSENDIWKNKTFSAADQLELAKNYPVEETPLVLFKSIMPLNPEGWYRTQIQATGADGQVRMYRLILSLNTHQALIRAALLRKLGYPVKSPRWYPKIKVKFSSSDEQKKFISEIPTQAGLVDSKRWVVNDDTESSTVLLQDVMLEPATITVPTSFYMGNLLATHIKGRRTLRALLIPFVLADVPESINMYSWEPVQRIDENLIFTHKYADAFSETTLDDIQWITRRLSCLTRTDWTEIVFEGHYPPDITAIILEKLIARRNNLVSATLIKNSLDPQMVTLPVDKNISIGGVDKGKVVQELYPGYALRFTHGDPESPLKTDDIVRFVKIEAQSSGIHQLTSLINEKLEFLTMYQLQQNRLDSLRNDFINHIQTNPTKPYVQPISTWGGPIGGIAVNASRSVITGSYFGDQTSDFQISLVDQVSAGARIGYFIGIDGIPKMFPGLGANLSVIRSYVHVRPIASLKAASKTSWKDLYVPQFMKNLGTLINPETQDSSRSQTADASTKSESDILTKFLDELKEGESFTVTDTIAIGENASIGIPLTTLLGLDPVTYINTVSFGITANQAVLRRTTFQREDGFIKIYLQNIQSQFTEVSLDFNLWMNISRIGLRKKWGQAQTRAFHLKESPTDEAEKMKTILALRGILSANNSELLETNFFPYLLNHKTQSDIRDGKFLFWRWTNIEEWHRVKLQPPEDPEHEFHPKDFERTLFSHKILQRTGHNYYAFLSDILDGAVQSSSFWRPGLLAANSGANPKDSFLGNAKWNVITTEGEVTRGKESHPITTIENYWAGWDISKADLFHTIDLIDDRLQSLGLDLPLVNRDTFQDMKRLQLYEVRTTLVIYQEGINNLNKILLKKNSNHGNVFKRLMGWDDFSGTDKNIVQNILIPLYGRQRFQDWCYAQTNSGEGGRSTATSYRGESYDCLMPWMWQLLGLRRSYPTERESQIKWTTQVINLLEQNFDLGQFINLLGKDNLFYQIKISGFRTRDENGDTADYQSSTIGTFNRQDRAGIFKDFVTDYQITSSEMNANYLSEGF